MPQAWVYGPLNSGKNWGMKCYCDFTPSNCITCYDPYEPTVSRCKHDTITLGQSGWGYEMDIGWVAGTPREIHCQVSSAIQSIKITYSSGMCANTSSAARHGLIVDLYTNTAGTAYIGSMMYAHIENGSQLANGLYLRTHSSFNNGGWVIARVLDLCPICSSCNCNCAVETHVHAQAKGSDAWNQKQCGVDIGRSTSIWRFDY